MLDQIPAAENWLAQFPLVDREVGRQLLRSLRLISNSQFERDLDEVLERLMHDVGEESLCLMSVPELVSQKRERLHPGKIFRQAGSSSDRIRNYLENFARVHSKRVRAHQTIESMRAERVRNVVLVEDFIGSGRRIATYLKQTMHPSLKSWISYGWTKLWIVAYGALSEGVWAIKRGGYRLSSNRFRLVTPAAYSQRFLSEPVIEFCRGQAYRTIRSAIPLGFNGGAANLIFEHGCPNNAPVILWSMGRQYKPLFPNRGIPSELRAAFGVARSDIAPEILWNASQYRLALSLLKEKSDGRQRKFWPLPVALGLASRSRWDDANIASALGMSILSVERLREVGVSLGALEASSNEVTAFGRSLLDLIRSNSAEPRMQISKKQRSLTALYYPYSCEGEAKH